MNEKNPRNWWQQIIDRIICCCRWLQFAIQDRVLLWWGRKYWQPKENPLISIIIPTRDRWGLLLERALSTILLQTYKNFEVIIVDDGSVERPYFGKCALLGHPKVQYYRIEKKFHYPKNAWCRWAAGPIRALNFALSKVKGDYLLRIDDDDILLPNALQDLVKAIKYNNVELLSAGHKFGRWGSQTADPYKIQGKYIGGIQTALMRSYLKYFKYNKDCWRKKWNSMNDVEILDRMIRTGVKTTYCYFTVCTVLPRPGQTEIGWKQQLNEYNSLEKM